MSEKVIYNCHIHTLTADESPTRLLKHFLWPWLGAILGGLLNYQWFVKPLVKLMKGINPKSTNDVLSDKRDFWNLG